MIIQAQTSIKGSRQDIWRVITDFENAPGVIRALDKIEILEKPDEGLTGLKWRETRTLFGKTATEIMWITKAEENAFFKTRAESHGSVYLTTTSLSEQEHGCVLTMELDSRPSSFLAGLLAVPMGFLFKKATQKAMEEDLRDIKSFIEKD